VEVGSRCFLMDVKRGSWLQKLIRAIVRPGLDRLAGEVELDETYYVGGVERGVIGRQTKRRLLW
jgi:hypothetical protein